MGQHVKVLGILFIVFGSLSLIGAFTLLLVFGGAAGIVGIVAQEEPDAAIALPIIGIVGLGLFLLILVVSIPEIFAGVGLLKFKAWGRVLGIVISVLSLMKFPLGTVLGGYGLWVLLSSETVQLFAGGQTQTEHR